MAYLSIFEAGQANGKDGHSAASSCSPVSMSDSTATAKTGRKKRFDEYDEDDLLAQITLTTTGQSLQEAMEVAEKKKVVGPTQADLTVMRIIHRNPGIQSEAIAKIIERTRQAVRNRVTRLIYSGLVHNHGAGLKCKPLWVLSDAGLKLLEDHK